jgi:hypothetical protein
VQTAIFMPASLAPRREPVGAAGEIGHTRLRW